MKFGKRLTREHYPPWAKNYIDYIFLKKSLKGSSRCKEAFATTFAKELEKVNLFYVFQLNNLKKAFASIQERLDKDAVLDSDLGSFCENLDLFRRFIVLNYVAVYKIIKKRNKVMKTETKLDHVTILKEQIFYTSEDIGRLYTQTRMMAHGLVKKISFGKGESSSSLSLEEEYTCPVCLDTLVSPVVLSCAHKFCWPCISRVAESMQACPVCRKEQKLDPNAFTIDTTLSAFLSQNFSPREVPEFFQHEKEETKKKLLTMIPGAYPKPSYLLESRKRKEHPTPWPFSLLSAKDKRVKSRLDEAINTATSWCINHQTCLGVDILCDGGMDCDNSLLTYAQTLKGVNSSQSRKKIIHPSRNETNCMVVDGEIQLACGPTIAQKWKQIAVSADRDIKASLPGPFSLALLLCDDYYSSRSDLCTALAQVLKEEVKALAQAGCKWIQIDEPLWSLYPEEAVEYGVGLVDEIFKTVSEHTSITTMVHACTSFPEVLDEANTLKASVDAYFALAKRVEEATAIKALSIEDAHRKIDLASVLPLLKTTKVVLGVLDVSSSRVESVKEIKERIEEALRHVSSRDHLLISPDCGMGLLPKQILHMKLSNMCQAVNSI